MSGINTKPHTLITGASRGLGKAFAMELARQKRNLILVSLPGENLRELTTDISATGINAVPYETDLTKKHDLLSLTKWINENYEVDVVINNAGVGGVSRFLDADPDMLDRMIQLNVRATTLITRQLLPNLLRQEKSYVLNIASLAALSPMAYKTAYPASKAFIYSFTRGLRKEFSDTGVSFSVVTPGPMRTREEITGPQKPGWGARVLNLTPDRVASLSLEKMFQGKEVIKLDWLHKLSLILLKLPAGITMSILDNPIRKELNSKGT